MKKIFLVALLLIVVQFSLVSAAYESVNYTVSDGKESPQFFITTLKYQPYPVNAGDWFDLWVKAENVGQDDAKNAQFELVPEYPFEAFDTVRNFGLIPGTTNARTIQQPGDSGIEANQVIMKFRVRAVDNAQYGQSFLKIRMKTDKNSDYSVEQNLPIEVEDTKTDFDVVMQESTDTGLSFALVNTGENPATALTVSVPTQQGIVVNGPKSSIIGNLDKGDFTTAAFQIIAQKNTDSVTLQLAYTDIAGVRNLVNKTVTINSVSSNYTTGTGFPRRATAASSTTSSKLLYIVIGAILGVAGMIIYPKIRHSKRKNETQ